MTRPSLAGAVQASYQVVIGTPDQVIAGLRCIRDTLGIGHLCRWVQDGFINHADTMADTVRCIELSGQEVFPALRGD